MSLLRAAMAGLLVGATIAPTGPAAAGSDEHQHEEAAMARTFEVGKLIDGRFTAVGTLVFDADNSGSLSLMMSGEVAEELETAWESIKGRQSLSIMRSEETEQPDGSTSHALKKVEVARDDRAYPEAVMDWLSWNHGLFGVEQTPAE